MSFKSDSATLSFSDLELSGKNTKNNTLDTLSDLSDSIDWNPIENRLMKNYPIGKKKKGPQAYSPIMLFKGLLLRNWFRIKSDADLESLINDRFSFKKFMGLAMGNPAPDSSTFSRFRRRLTLDRYEQVLSDISDQLANQNLIINMGTALDLKIKKSG